MRRLHAGARGRYVGLLRLSNAWAPRATRPLNMIGKAPSPSPRALRNTDVWASVMPVRLKTSVLTVKPCPGWPRRAAQRCGTITQLTDMPCEARGGRGGRVAVVGLHVGRPPRPRVAPPRPRPPPPS